jgi:hypothetical protein
MFRPRMAGHHQNLLHFILRVCCLLRFRTLVSEICFVKKGIINSLGFCRDSQRWSYPFTVGRLFCVRPVCVGGVVVLRAMCFGALTTRAF